MAISFAAYKRGWQVGEPLTLPGYDLLDPGYQSKAERYIQEFDPDLLLVAWPCTKWSVLQVFGRKTVDYLLRLAKYRAEQRRLVDWVQKVVLERRALGCATIGENPFSSKAWNESVNLHV